MKRIKIILGLVLFASVTTFAQSPRIKLNQITKDTVKGSVLISSPSDSGMVYSRDFYVAYGADTVLILYGDTLAATSGIISSVLSDGVTITGNGTSGNELKVDTSLIATIKALNDSLATISASTTPDGVTITGDGSVGNPLKVDTATVISTIQGLVDSLSNYVTLSGAETITGAKTFTNTFTQSGGDANFDSGTLYVDESANRVGIGTSSPSEKLNVNGNIGLSGNGTGNRWILLNETNTYAGTFKLQAGGGSASYGGAINMYGHSHATKPGDVAVGISDGSGGSFRVNSTGIDTGTDLFIVESTGNVGINEINPSQKLDVNGKVKIQDLTGTGGNAVYENGGVLGVASDARFKTYVGDIQNGITLINQLKPKYFIDNRNSSFQQLGFYAQEVKSVINEASYPIGNTDYLGINDRAILATTVKAIQEQQAIIETQEQKITDLETTIQALITRIEILENK